MFTITNLYSTGNRSGSGHPRRSGNHSDRYSLEPQACPLVPNIGMLCVLVASDHAQDQPSCLGFNRCNREGLGLCWV